MANSEARIARFRETYEQTGSLYSAVYDEYEQDFLRDQFSVMFGHIYDPIERALMEGHGRFELKASAPLSKGAENMTPRRGEVTDQNSRWKLVHVTAQKYKHWPQEVQWLKRYAGRARIIEALIALGWTCCWGTGSRETTDDLAENLVKILRYYVLRPTHPALSTVPRRVPLVYGERIERRPANLFHVGRSPHTKTTTN